MSKSSKKSETAPPPPPGAPNTTGTADNFNYNQHSSHQSVSSTNKSNNPNKATHAVDASLKFAARSVAVVKAVVPGKNILFAPIKDDYRWEQLQHIEKKCRAILLNVEEPWWRVLMHWDGTVLRILAWDMAFWLTLGLHVAVRIVARWELPECISELPTDSIAVLGGFLSFFLVFWVNQSHKRFFSLYENSMGCKGRIFDAATLAVTHLPHAQVTRLIRCMNCAHAASYVGLSEIYPSGNYFNYVNKTMGLLTEQERARLDQIDLDKGGSCN